MNQNTETDWNDADDVILDGDDEGSLEVSKDDSKNIMIEKNDRSLSEFYRWYGQKRLEINPEWQRQYVWDKKRASRLIESFLMDIPIPVVYLYKHDSGNYDVIDGVQRLTSVFNFFDDKLKLSSLELMPELEGKLFSELDMGQKNKLNDVTLRTFELSPKTSDDLLFIIFERLNTGGMALSEMEIRNCIYRGKLNSLIRELAIWEEFTNILNQNDISKRMKDRELVLRFLAFYERGYNKINTSLKGFLNDLFENYRNPTDRKLKEFEKIFKKSIQSAFTVFGKNAFRIRKLDSNGNGQWNRRLNASIFQVISVSFAEYERIQITQRADAIFEEYLDLISSDRRWFDSISRNTGNVNEIKYAFRTWIERLNKVMSSTIPLDTKRLFSASLKDELFKQNHICQICKQEVKAINDAALDHEKHYWRGGKTIPSNARLVHRLCNQKREN